MAEQCSLQGGRLYNEDVVYCSPTENGFIAMVADGLGGHGGGRVAAGTSVKCIANGYVASPKVEEAFLYSLVKEANRAVLTNQTPQIQMKSTLAAFFCDENKWASVHIGDSRLYHFHNDCLRFQTTDHSVSQMAVLAGEILQTQIRGHADRNKLLRALGGKKEAEPEIHLFNTPLTKEDALLLCSDGFWELLYEEEMALELSKSGSPKEWLSGMLRRIGRRLTEKSDNLSAIALFFNE